MKNKYYDLTVADRGAEVLIYGDIASCPWGENGVSAYSLASEISGLDVDVIDVRINSYGGECAEAMAIVNSLDRHPATVNTYNDGFACSAAATIFMAGAKRVAGRYSNFMVHDAWTVAEGNAAELRREADNLDKITQQSKILYLSKCSLTEAELDELMAQEIFLTPREALEMGFATEIAEDEENAASQSVRRMIFTLVSKHKRAQEGGTENTGIRSDTGRKKEKKTAVQDGLMRFLRGKEE